MTKDELITIVRGRRDRGQSEAVMTQLNWVLALLDKLDGQPEECNLLQHLEVLMVEAREKYADTSEFVDVWPSLIMCMAEMMLRKGDDE